MKSKEETRKSNLKSSILLLLLLAILLITSTYAWFTTAKEAKISGISLSVTSDNDGLDISVDAKEWLHEITNANFIKSKVDTEYPNNINKFPEKLVPCTTTAFTQSLGGYNTSPHGLGFFRGRAVVTSDDMFNLFTKFDEKDQNELVIFDLFVKTSEFGILRMGKDTGPEPVEGSLVHAATRLGVLIEGTGLDESDVEKVQNAFTTKTKEIDYMLEPYAKLHNEKSQELASKYRI